MYRLVDFKDKHKGQTCAILGGGVSLPEDLRRIPQVDCLIGINHHSIILPLDYIVFLDREMWKYVETVDGCWKVSSCGKFKGRSDFIHIGDAPIIGFSGALAVWFADQLGFETIYVCGIDQYQDKNGREYWWQATHCEPFEAKHKSARDDLTRWKQFLLALQHPENVYFVSGRLKELHQ